MHPISAIAQRRRRRKFTHHHSSHHGHHGHHHGGVRTVELRRGRGGFGFTISGQRPCILSCIVAGSPAERAGLRPGDHLVSVNGRGVARAPHDDVVRLVGDSAPLLTLKVAETYYFSPSSDTTASDTEAASPAASSSSDGGDGELMEKSNRSEGLVKICGAVGGRIPPPDRSYMRPRPPRMRHINKPRTRSSGGVRMPSTGRSPSAARGSSLAQATPARAARVVQDLRTGAMFQEMATLWGQQAESLNHSLDLPMPPSILMPPPVIIPSRPPLRKERKERKERRSTGAVLVPRHRERLPAMPYASLESRTDAQGEVLGEDDGQGASLTDDIVRKVESVLSPFPIYKAVVGYLGSIELPEEGRRMQVVRGCIRRMRAERRAHAVVLLSVRSGRRRRRCVEVMSASGNTLASYPADRIAALCACGDARFFGLVVTTSPLLLDGDHQPPSIPLTGRSSCHVFAVEPGLRPHQAHAAHACAFGINCTGGCFAFPDSAIPVLQAIATICGGAVNKGNHSGTASGTDDLDSPGVLNRRGKMRVENVRASLGDLLLLVDPCAPPVLASVTPSLSSGGRHPSSTSSNSDSGIGFRDDRVAIALDVSDREVPQSVLENNNTTTSCPCASGGRLTVRAMPDPVITKCQYPDRKANEREFLETEESSQDWVTNNSSSFATSLPKPSSSSSLCSFGNIRVPDAVIEDPVLSYKLSPKVYGLPAPKNISNMAPLLGGKDDRRRSRMKSAQGMTHSLEDIQGSFERSNQDFFNVRARQGSLECVSDGSIASKAPASQIMSGTGGGLWGSLQDLRCLDSLPLASHHHFLSRAEVGIKSTSQEGDGCLSDLEQLDHQPLNKWSNAAGFCRALGTGDDRPSPRLVNYLTASDDDVYKRLSLGKDGESKVGSSAAEKEGKIEVMIGDTVSSLDGANALMGPPPIEERAVDIGRVGGWASSFERLLEDPIGLHTFAEFLKKEFSAENIYFWVACERYRNTPNDPAKTGEGTHHTRRAVIAQDIFNRHLCLGAPEPVNVDSHARQETEEGLGAAQPTLFLQAQKQIFNLMKFDSYPRFLKSDLYKECLLKEMSGQSVSFGSVPDADLCLTSNQDGDDEVQAGKQLKKSRSDAEERRRKSLLPWHRKNRSKSKDRGETDYQKMRAAAAVVATAHTLLPNRGATDDASSSRSDLASSRSSLASSDLALIQRGALARQSLTSSEWSAERADSGGGPCPLCRVILPDGATTVVNTGASKSVLQPQPLRQTVRELVTRLLDKRGLKYSAFEVYFCDNSSASDGKPLNLEEDVQMLGSREVRVERRVIFRVDLPSRKTIGVKSGPDRTLGHVLRPILHKYGYKLENVALCLMSENEVLEPSLPVTAVDNEKVQVLTKNGDGWKTENGTQGCSKADRLAVQGAPTLDEITNRVFEELLAGKVAEEKSGVQFNDDVPSTSEDQASVKSEDWSSEHSSGIFGRFLRRDSGSIDKSRESRLQKVKKGSMKKLKQSVHGGICNTSAPGASNASAAPGTGAMQALTSDFAVSTKIPATPRLKSGVRPQGHSENDELYEGLKRAQRSRLEDQRGTEINFELPDFLKDKENTPQVKKKSRKGKRGEDERKFSFENMKSSAAPLSSSAAFVSRLLDCDFGGMIPSSYQADYFSEKEVSSDARCVSLPNPPSTLIFQEPPRHRGDPSSAAESGSEARDDEALKSPSSSTNCALFDKGDLTSKSSLLHCKPELSCPHQPPVPPPPRTNCDPPPLPPKPKNLPVSSSSSSPTTVTITSKIHPLLRATNKGWSVGNSTLCSASGDEGVKLSAEKGFAQESAPSAKRDSRVCRSRRAIYLDQPSSSFV